MWSPRRGSQTRPDQGRHLAVWAALAVGWMLPSTGCQVEYAGMTLPSGKYMHDDVQYFPPGTDFPWANTQAATQRARMQARGMEVPAPGTGGPLTVTPGQGALPPVQNQMGRPTDVNQGGLSDLPPMPDQGAGPAPGGAAPVVPAAPMPGGDVVPPPGGAGAMPAPGGAGAGEGAGAVVPPPGNP